VTTSRASPSPPSAAWHAGVGHGAGWVSQLGFGQWRIVDLRSCCLWWCCSLHFSTFSLSSLSHTHPPSNNLQGWCQAHQRPHLRGDPWRAQGVP
jgi:hypothetical protein